MHFLVVSNTVMKMARAWAQCNVVVSSVGCDVRIWISAAAWRHSQMDIMQSKADVSRAIPGMAIHSLHVLLLR